MKLALDLLPPRAHTLIHLIGADAAFRLIVHYGGKTIRPSRGGTPETAAFMAELAERIGQQAADRLGEEYRNAPLPVPRCARAVAAAAREDVRLKFDRLTRQGLSAREAVHRLAGEPPWHYVERTIWELLSQTETSKIVKLPRREARVDEQGELF